MSETTDEASERIKRHGDAIIAKARWLWSVPCDLVTALLTAYAINQAHSREGLTHKSKWRRCPYCAHAVLDTHRCPHRLPTRTGA